MKHSDSGNRKIIKQLKNCREILAVVEKKKGYLVQATNGEQRLVHPSPKAYHDLRRWCNKNTSLQLKF